MGVNNGRLFTFGCSLTRYHWPTWADILGQSFDEFYNFANRGAGNRQIMERFAEAVARIDFTGNDVIIIQWTDYHRFDQHIWDPELPESWYPGGNIFSSTEADPMKGFVINKMWNEKSYQMHTFNYIYAGVALARQTRCRVLMTFGQDLRPELLSKEFKNYRKFIQNNYWIDSDIYNWTVQNCDERLSFKGARLGDLSEEPTMDYHPTPIMYYKWLVERIQTTLNIQIDKKFAMKMQDALVNCKNYNDIGQAIKEAGYDCNKHYIRGM